MSKETQEQILQALQELPFDVGRKLLADHLQGNYNNKSISKNKLDELPSFGTITTKKEELLEHIEKLVRKGHIEQTTSDYNKYIKILRLSAKGKKSLQEEEKEEEYNIKKSPVTEKEKEQFKTLEVFLKGYNNEQKKAIINNNKHILCIAGAGTGKTTTLTKRIEYLTRNKNTPQEKILAITFTRKAAQEMQHRLQQQGITGIHVHTFNSFCEQILKKYDSLIYDIPTRVLSYTDKILAMNTAQDYIGYNMEEAIDLYFSTAQKNSKNKQQLSNMFMNDCYTLLDYLKTNGGWNYDFTQDVETKDKRIATIIRKTVLYLKDYMKQQGLRDYTDQLLDATQFLKEHKERIPQYEHILVDEYQDVNNTQIELLELLQPKNLFAVGDPRQSIFGWRGSNIKHIIEFEKKYPEAEIIHLTTNYRSKKNLVEFTNKAIQNMKLPALQTNNEEEGTILIQTFENEQAEKLFIIESIQTIETPKEEIFILARTNRQLEDISQTLTQKNIPHVVRTEEARTQTQKGAITLATVHAIKGLEATTVYLIGANDQNFPCKANDHPILELIKLDTYDRIEEERRLFYVALSRAKKQLIITHTNSEPTYFITEEMLTLGK